MGSVLGAVGSLFGPVGGILGTIAGGLIGGHGGGGGGGSPSQPQLPGNIDPQALAAAISALPAQQAATSAGNQYASILNKMGSTYGDVMGAIPFTSDISSGLDRLFNPAGDVAASNYQVGQLQNQGLTAGTNLRNQLAARGITGPVAEALISQGVTEPEMTGEANIRALGAANATKNMTTGLDWLKGMVPNPSTLLTGSDNLMNFFSKQAQQATAPYLAAAGQRGYQAGYGGAGAPGGYTPGAGAAAGANAGAGADGIGLPPMPYQSAQDASGGTSGFVEGSAMPGYPPPTYQATTGIGMYDTPQFTYMPGQPY